MSRLRTLWIALVATLAICPIARAATYTVTDLGTLGGNRSGAAAINARGDVVGWSTLAGDSAIHAFLYQSRHGRMIDLDPRGAGASSSATAINDRDRIAGDIAAGGDANHAALFVRGRIVDLGTPTGFPSASAIAINHAGDVLIQAEVGFAPVEGLLLHHGRTSALPIQSAWGLNDRRQTVGSVGPPLLQRAVVVNGNTVTDPTQGFGAQSTVATAINARGDVAGGYLLPGGSTGGAFLERDGVVTDLGTLPGGGFAVAFALNSHDQVVGYVFDIGTGFGEHAFLYDARLDPPMQDLNDLIPPNSGIELTQATGINDRGSIVGIAAVNGTPVLRAVLLTPNPSSG